MMITRPTITKLNGACLHICCLYAVYMALINGLAGISVPYVLLIPGYFAAAILYKAGTYFTSSEVIIKWAGLLLGLIYAAFLIVILTRYSPWSWLMDQHEFLLKFPIKVIISKCDELSILGIGALLWFLGWRQAKLNMDFIRMFAEFQMGFGVLFLVSVMTHGFNISISGLPHIVGIFFGLGLTSLILSRNVTFSHSDQAALSHHKFLYGFFGILLIFLLGMAIAMLVNPALTDKILSLGAWLKHVLLRLVDMFMNLLPTPVVKPFDSLEAYVKGRPQTAPSTVNTSARKFREIGSIVYVLIWSGIILFVLWRMSVSIVAFFKNLQNSSQNVRVESMNGAFKSDVLQWIYRSWKTLKKTIHMALVAVPRGLLARVFPAHFTHEPQILTLYAKLLKWSKKKGIQRNPEQTVSEHVKDISHVAPQTKKHLMVIAGFYEKYRYGNMDLSSDDDASVLNAWRQLKKITLKH